jgi:hypothetical protein
MQCFAIVGLCVLAAVTYGVLHDQVTARVCVEYFTIGHPPIFGTQDPTLLGLGWGVLATWWVGVLLGLPLAAAARLGRRPQRTAASLIRPVTMLMLVSAGCALVAGVVGYGMAKLGVIGLFGPVGRAIPPARHVAFLADLWAHNASYLSGFVGGGILIFRVWQRRSLAGLDN